MAQREYHVLSTTHENVNKDLRIYTNDGWKPILLSSCTVAGIVETVVHITILLEK
jgi:hypothetical protein